MSSMTRGAVLRPIYYLFEQGTLVGSSDVQLLERFVATRDETAFEALVARHGRSVQAVCRDVLRDQHDAEDAFQATFLILVRKAGSLWVKDSLAAWLHRVARRVAVEANRQKTRRRAFEQSGVEIDMAPTRGQTPFEALREAIHEEIDRLPEKYRAPIILCDMEELTRDEAACRLGWPPGTVAGRLARARMLLRDRIARARPLRCGRRTGHGRRKTWRSSRRLDQEGRRASDVVSGWHNENAGRRLGWRCGARSKCDNDHESWETEEHRGHIHRGKHSRRP